MPRDLPQKGAPAGSFVWLHDRVRRGGRLHGDDNRSLILIHVSLYYFIAECIYIKLLISDILILILLMSDRILPFFYFLIIIIIIIFIKKIKL